MQELRLDCKRCGEFRTYGRESDDPDTVVRCDECGKRHSTASIYSVDPDRQYRRDEAGTLTDPRIPK